MFAPIIRPLLCLALCLMLFSCMECGDQCVEYQDVAKVENVYLDINERYIDSVVMIVNDSIIGCGDYAKAVGSKTHHVKFPINVRLQLFLQGDLWKEFFVEMDKNTQVRIYTGIDCSRSVGTPVFFRDAELAKEDNRFIDSSLTNDYCWLLEKMAKSPSIDNMRCTEFSVDGKQELCGKRSLK